jgi:DNA-directed RNA polymerase specialized sigma24 family protein
VPEVGEAHTTRCSDSHKGERDLELLYRDAGPRLWRSIYGFSGGRRHLAEDAVAEAFARAIEHQDEIRDLLAWIYPAAFRIASRELKRERRPLPPMPDRVPGLDPSEVQDILRALEVDRLDFPASACVTSATVTRPRS